MVVLHKYFKALTGGDNLRFEEKNKNVGEPFVIQEWLWFVQTNQYKQLITLQVLLEED